MARIKRDFLYQMNDQIAANISARKDHAFVLEKNNLIMKDINERAAAYFVQTKRHHEMLQKICKNAVTGTGSENIPGDFRGEDFLCGNLADPKIL